MNKQEIIEWVKMTFDDYCFNEYDKKCCCATIVDFLGRILPDSERGECKFLFYSRNDFQRMVSTFVCTNCEAHILAENTSDIPKCSLKYCPNCGDHITRIEVANA